MALLDRLQQLDAAPRCKLARLIDTLNDEEATLLKAHLDNPKITTYSIWTTLREEGYKANRGTIQAHRSHTCLCHEGTA